MTAPVPSLEIRIPISPTDLFFRRIHYFAASLRAHGGPCAGARVVVVMGADEEPFDPRSRLPWAGAYPIDWVWMARERFRRHSFFGTRLERFLLPARSDVVLMLDADVLVAAPFHDLVARVHAEQALLGVPANVSPVRPGFRWEDLFAAAGLGPVPYAVEHSGFGCLFHDEARRRSPPYFNLGVIPLPSALCERIGAGILDELEIVSRLEPTFRGQMSLTLALVRLRIPWATMPFRYNFVNDERYLLRYRADFDDLRLLHFLVRRSIDKDEAFASAAAIERTLRSEPAGAVDRRFLELLAAAHAIVSQDPS